MHQQPTSGAASAPPSKEAWNVSRTLQILELLAFSPLSVPQVAAALYLQPRTVRRVINRLEQEGYVTVYREGRRSHVYTPTLRLVALAGQMMEQSPLRSLSRPTIELLHARTGAAAHLMVPSYDSALCLVHVGVDDVDASPRLRELIPAHCTAAGKALLAWRDRWRESVLSVPLASHTPRTVTDPERLRRELEQVRVDGYALEDEEYRPGARAVAAPVLADGQALAAISVSGPGLDAAAVLHAVTAAASQFSDELQRARR